MSLSSHVQELRRKHQTLSDQVEKAQKRPSVDAARIAEMKKQKLRLKEEITRLSPQM
ncbi:YdcH family protein [Halodurantibacterium flavum]|uniref:YdcH family protein n=1 Tax=Halodurantibacterium flavum TaxID=1382802 RepID=A0ABW4S8D7_9RHOB